jgi:hypothetical protein
MAVVVRGLTKCGICGRVIDENDPVTTFPTFVSNRRDALFMFNDAGFHEWCVDRHPAGPLARQTAAEAMARLGPRGRICAACSVAIEDPDDYFAIGYLTGRASDPAHAYNFIQLHRRHIGTWAELTPAIRALEQLRDSDVWEGGGLEEAILELRRHLS